MVVKTSQSTTEVNSKANFQYSLSNSIIEAVISPLFTHHACCSKLNTMLFAHVLIFSPPNSHPSPV